MLKPHITKPKDKDKIAKWQARSLSYSQIASFEYNKEQWYKSYVDPAEFTTSPELTFGSRVDLLYQQDPNFIPQVPRGEMLQHKMRVNFAGISIVGIPDSLSIKKEKVLADLKTGRVAWTQQKAQTTGQLLMYLFLIYKEMGIKPEEFDCYIYWVPTMRDDKDEIQFVDEKDVKIFKVKHTLADVLRYMSHVKEVYEEMKEYIEDHA